MKLFCRPVPAWKENRALVGKAIGEQGGCTVAKASRVAALAAVVVVLVALGICATPLRNVLLAALVKGNRVSTAVGPVLTTGAQTAPSASVSGDQAAQASLDRLYLQGYQYYNEELYQKAINLEDQVIQEDPASFAAYTVKGIALVYYGYFDGGNMKTRDFDEGMQNIDRALALKPDYTAALFNKALAYELYANYDTALYWYDRAIAIDPKSVWSYYGKAAIYGRRGDVPDTVEYLKQAIDLNPEVKKFARQEEDFNNVKNSLEFQNLVN
jgi:tetratricopeptide (TPR) repeat protein